MAKRRQLGKPPRWSQDQLEAERRTALANFIQERGEEGTRAYEAAFRKNEPVIRRLFALTKDLREFGGHVITTEPELLAAARYLAGPPVSADDLETLVEGSLSRRSIHPDLAEKAASVLRAVWDPMRFPWLTKNRAPKRAERDAAISWTAGIWAVEQLRTLRRTESSRRQEELVVQALSKAGFEEQPRLRALTNLDDLPRGSFTRETNLAGSKCDIPARLRDGRLLAIECKVSNSALNSVKRLIRETEENLAPGVRHSEGRSSPAPFLLVSSNSQILWMPKTITRSLFSGSTICAPSRNLFGRPPESASRPAPGPKPRFPDTLKNFRDPPDLTILNSSL